MTPFCQQVRNIAYHTYLRFHLRLLLTEIAFYKFVTATGKKMVSVSQDASKFQISLNGESPKRQPTTRSLRFAMPEAGNN